MSWQNEYDDALMSDKFGHIYSTYTFAKLLGYAWQLTGLDTMTSAYIASLSAILAQTYVELQDGFSHGRTYLGFSRGDMLTNA